VFNGRSVTSGIVGSIRAIVESRYACRSAATSCHVAPDAIVTVTSAIESDERGKLLSEDREGSEKGEED
jgi:hypothetical protein